MRLSAAKGFYGPLRLDTVHGGVVLSEEVSITVPIKRTAQDYREAYAWLRWHSWAWPSTVVIAAVIALEMLLKGGVHALPSVALGALVLAGLYLFGLVSIVSRMQNAHKKNGETSYTFNGNGFDYESAVSRSQTAWDAVNRAVETRRSFLLVYANTCFLIIPKRCVREGDIPALRDLFRSHLNSRARLSQCTHTK